MSLGAGEQGGGGVGLDLVPLLDRRVLLGSFVVLVAREGRRAGRSAGIEECVLRRLSLRLGTFGQGRRCADS